VREKSPGAFAIIDSFSKYGSLYLEVNVTHQAYMKALVGFVCVIATLIGGAVGKHFFKVPMKYALFIILFEVIATSFWSAWETE
jgi:hypothetical protein